MMDPELARLVDADTPALNPALAGGLAVVHFKDIEKYVDDVLRAAFGPMYVGYRRCLPAEEFKQVTKARKLNNSGAAQRTFDMAQSTVHMNQYMFTYNGEELEPRYLYLPYVTPGAHLIMRGSTWHISPVLADRVISVAENSIFVRLLRDRWAFERTSQYYLANGLMESAQVVWSKIHHIMKKPNIRRAVKAHTAIAHYLFCRYGVVGTFEKFANCKPIFGTAETFAEEDYPRDQWVVCSSNGIRPRTAAKYWNAPELMLAVRRRDYTPDTKNLIAGFFYVLDHFPERLRKPEWVHNDWVWKVMLGLLIYGVGIPEGTLYAEIGNHFESLDSYLDEIIRVRLREDGNQIDDAYELLGTVVKEYDGWLYNAADKVSSMYGKELNILYFVLFEITYNIFMLNFQLKAKSKKENPATGQKKELSAREISKEMGRYLKPNLIFNLVKKSGIVSSLNAPDDNMAFKTTSIMQPQSGSSRQNKKKEQRRADDPMKRAHISTMEIGCYTALPKSDPDGHHRLNHHALIDERGMVLRHEDLREILDPITPMLR